MNDDNGIKLILSGDEWRLKGRQRLIVIEKIESMGFETIIGIDGSRSWVGVTDTKGNSSHHSKSLTPLGLCKDIFEVTGIRPSLRFGQDGSVVLKVRREVGELELQEEPEYTAYNIYCGKKKLSILDRCRLFFSRSKIVVSDMTNITVTTSGNPTVIGEAEIYFPSPRDNRYRVNCIVPDIGSFTDIYVLNEEFEKRIDFDEIRLHDCKFDVMCSTTKDVYRLQLFKPGQKPGIMKRCDELHRHEKIVFVIQASS